MNRHLESSDRRRRAFARLAPILACAVAGCASMARPADGDVHPGTVARPVATRTYLDVHHVGPGKVHLHGVADAHQHDLAMEGDYGVDYERYWVDEASGTIYCLVHAVSAVAAATVHREAHGLVADELHEVHCSAHRRDPKVGAPLFLVTLDTGNNPGVAAAATNALERHILASGHGPRCLEYWFDATSGHLFGLLEAVDGEAAAGLCRGVDGVRVVSLLPVVAGG